ncbi:DUF3231 family protein [Cytobacillus oceanisediminis]|uniref:DUF3231 family protein n=1 Tax=Cytobacillus oceanisediminis TaxID=665099 RepID=UPI001FB326B4|nr:DUF3231 family protein [Cytobacillus oceanisediminis]MDF2036297.1 DUF3231 family protein [Cytobacillus oceanisediminis]UOE53628.1 DUF3231 family protein [Cytobacillus oceanisediminis]
MNLNELGFLWYLHASSNMVNVFLGNLIETAEDTDLKDVLTEIKALSSFQEQEALQFLSDNGLNVTPFFSENDLHSPSEKIFSDQLMIEIIKHITSNGLGILSFQYTDLTVPKVKNFFKEILNKLIQIDISILNLLEHKGLLQNRSFSYTNAEDRESKLFKVASTQQRPLNAVELASMFGSFQCNNVGLALCTAFSDAAKDEDTKSFLQDGIKLSYHQVDVLSQIYRENGVPTTTGLEAHVHKVNKSPFSDKLMANLIMFLNPIGIGNLQTAVVSSYKKSHVKTLKELIDQVEGYSEKGFKLLVRKDWLNEPPVTNRSIDS